MVGDKATDQGFSSDSATSPHRMPSSRKTRCDRDTPRSDRCPPADGVAEQHDRRPRRTNRYWRPSLRRVRRATAVALVVAGGLLAGWTAPVAADQDKGLLRGPAGYPRHARGQCRRGLRGRPGGPHHVSAGVGYGTVSGVSGGATRRIHGEHATGRRGRRHPAGADDDGRGHGGQRPHRRRCRPLRQARAGDHRRRPATPPTGQARIRALDGASNAQTVDVTTADGTAIAKALPFAATGDDVDLPQGRRR